MIPQEQAKDLVEKFVSITFWNGYITSAKKCAMIAVDEIIKVINSVGCHEPYWEEVKREIEKL